MASCSQLSETKVCSIFTLIWIQDEEEKPSEKVQATPGKLKMSFEELEKERQEHRKRQAEEEAKRRLIEEKKAFEEARLGMVDKSSKHQQTPTCLKKFFNTCKIFYYPSFSLLVRAIREKMKRMLSQLRKTRKSSGLEN